MKSIVTASGVEILIDDEDYDLVAGSRWFVSTRGYAFKKIYHGKYAKVVMLHRLIMGIQRGDPRIIDHANGVKTDNRRCNLRLCTKSQNGYNQPAQKNNTTGYKGVTFISSSGKFMAQIRHDGKKKHLGLFSSAQEAHDAYCVAALELHGEFANFGDVPADRAALSRSDKS